MLPFETHLGLTVVNIQLCATQPSRSKGYLAVFQTPVVLRILVSKETFDSNETRQSRGSLRSLLLDMMWWLTLIKQGR